MQESEQASRPEEHPRHDRRQEEQEDNPADLLPATCASEAVDPYQQTEAQQLPGGRPQALAAARQVFRHASGPSRLTRIPGRLRTVSVASSGSIRDSMNGPKVISTLRRSRRT